ncbi:MAG: pyruvate formate lyase family protein, partial [Clostridia bacterium]|nr:pyruvate formate lyase family protein [Clostridia bacterium]
MARYYTEDIAKSPRIDRLKDALFAKMPELEVERAVLLTESYKNTEGMPMITRRAKAFRNILENLPITIGEDELIVGSATKSPRSCQIFPEFSFEWIEDEFDTIETRAADPFHVSNESKKALSDVFKYWKGKTTSELATAYMRPETLDAISHNIFTPGNYFYNGIGHVTVAYDKVLEAGFDGIIKQAKAELEGIDLTASNAIEKRVFLEAVIESCEAAITYAQRYSRLAYELAEKCTDPARREELRTIGKICSRVPQFGAESFYEACQSFWFVQLLIQTESNGHSISPGRFDVYMYPYYKKDLKNGKITREFAQELMDCVWIKLNSFTKVRDDASAQGFAGYSLFQNLIAGGQDKNGVDITNDLSFMCINASMHVMLPQPSLS